MRKVIYNKILINYNDESFRLTRIKSLIDNLLLYIPEENLNNIIEIEDNKGTLIIYWVMIPTKYEEQLINKFWKEQNETYTKHIYNSLNNVF